MILILGRATLIDMRVARCESKTLTASLPSVCPGFWPHLLHIQVMWPTRDTSASSPEAPAVVAFCSTAARCLGRSAWTTTDANRLGGRARALFTFCRGRYLASSLHNRSTLQQERPRMTRAVAYLLCLIQMPSCRLLTIRVFRRRLSRMGRAVVSRNFFSGIAEAPDTHCLTRPCSARNSTPGNDRPIRVD